MRRPASDRLVASLERRLGGVFYLYGDEEHLKDAAAAVIANAHLDSATRDFNIDKLRGGSVDAETLVSICNTPPMMAEWRVVVVRDAHQLASTAALRSAVQTLLDQTIPGLALILVASGSTKTKFHRNLAANARSAEYRTLSEGDLPGWLMERAEQAEVTLEAAAARALAAAAGPGLSKLLIELDKLISFAAERGTISKSDVAQLVGNVPSVNRWDWIDTVGERRLADARQQLPVLLSTGESGVGLVIALGTQFLRIATAVAGGRNAIQAALPSNQQFLVQRIMRQARNWTAPETEAALEALLRADRLLKSAGLADALVLDELLLTLEYGRPVAA